MFLQVRAKQADPGQARIADVVLDSLNIPGHGRHVDPEQEKKACQELVSEANALRDPAAALRERESPIALVLQVPEPAELLDHDAYAGPAKVQFARDVRDPRVALLDHEILDSFQVILLADRNGGFRAHVSSPDQADPAGRSFLIQALGGSAQQRRGVAGGRFGH